MRAVLAALPDGRWRCEDVLDSTGAAPDQQRPARIVVTVTIDGDEITFDFTGTDPQARGNVNAVTAVTVSAVAFALRTADRPDHPGQRRLAATGARRRPGRHARERAAAGRGRCRQRRGEPAHRRRVPRRAGPGRARSRRRRRPGDDEQRPHRRRGLGVLRDHRRRRGRPAAPRRHARRPHRDDQQQEHADRGAGADLPAAGARATGCARGAGARAGSPAARASSATSRCSRTAR